MYVYVCVCVCMGKTRLKSESWKVRIHTQTAAQSRFHCFSERYLKPAVAWKDGVCVYVLQAIAHLENTEKHGHSTSTTITFHAVFVCFVTECGVIFLIGNEG